MMIIDFVGYPGSGKSTIMSKIEDPDIVKWVDLPPVKRLSLVRHLLGSRFFWRNFFLILRASWICGFHGRKKVKGRWKNLEVVLHSIYHAERFSESHKIYIVEKGPVSVLPVRSGVHGYKVVEKLLDRIVERFPYSIIYFYSDVPSIIRNLKKRRTETDEKMLASPVLKRRIRRGKETMERNIEWIRDKLVHVAWIKTDEDDLDKIFTQVKKEMKRIRKIADERNL